MKKNILILLLILSIKVQAQIGFGEGYYVTNKNDTIRGRIEVYYSYQGKFQFEDLESGDFRYIKIKDVKCLYNGYNYFRKVKYHDRKKERINVLRIIQNGKITLLYEWPEGTFKNTIVLLKDNEAFLLTTENFSTILRPLIEDIPAMLNRFDENQLKFKNISQIIQTYNRSFR